MTNASSNTGTLQTGLIGGGAGLQAVLKSAGVVFSSLPAADEVLSGRFKVIIFGGAAPLAEKHRQALESFVRSGGLLLETGLIPVLYNEGHISLKKVSYLINKQQHSGFCRLRFIDVYSDAALTENETAYFDGLVDFQPYGQGFVGRIGLDFDALWSSSSWRRKRFFGVQGAVPDELVSSFDRTGAADLLEITLLELHIRAGLPLLTKWHSPVKKPVFAFRVDTDYSTQESLMKLYMLAEKYGLKLTWFLHTEAHEPWLDFFQSFKNQEMALHCYRHGTSRSADKIANDVHRAAQALNRADIPTRGYAAPYGIFTEGHKKALSSFRRLYSSDFTTGYDGRPFHLPLDKKGIEILQIPVHPVCTGSLRRRGYTENEMSVYFNRIADEKAAHFEPVILYHHPLQPGLNAIEQIFARANNEELHNLTFAEYAGFWKKRDTFTFKAEISDGKITLETTAGDSMLLKYAHNHAGFSLINSDKTEFPLTPENEFTYGSVPERSTDEIKSLRSGRLRLLKTSLFDYKNRNRL